MSADINKCPAAIQVVHSSGATTPVTCDNFGQSFGTLTSRPETVVEMCSCMNFENRFHASTGPRSPEHGIEAFGRILALAAALILRFLLFVPGAAADRDLPLSIRPSSVSGF